MRLALARALTHPISATVREAGWEPVPFFPTEIHPTRQAPPLPPEAAEAVLVLSPSAAAAASPWLRPDMVCLATGQGTKEALGALPLGRPDLEVLTPRKPNAESLWELLQKRFPRGGEFLLARGHRSREVLEHLSEGTKWRVHPWITHEEVIRDPQPPVPEADALLALSPVQALAMVPIVDGMLRFAWGPGAARIFQEAGVPADGVCDPDLASLRKLLETPQLRKSLS
ncbi:MAG TPA: uroporphyrinogen-III synthase [Holophagaceae bacterium]|nr:uroporphyrinogen-III synthase [Holophagaceae bacterium]